MINPWDNLQHAACLPHGRSVFTVNYHPANESTFQHWPQIHPLILRICLFTAFSPPPPPLGRCTATSWPLWAVDEWVRECFFTRSKPCVMATEEATLACFPLGLSTKATSRLHQSYESHVGSGKHQTSKAYLSIDGPHISHSLFI